MYVKQIHAAVRAFEQEFPGIEALSIQQNNSAWPLSVFVVSGVEMDGPMRRVVLVEVHFKQSNTIPCLVRPSEEIWKNQVHCNGETKEVLPKPKKRGKAEFLENRRVE